MADEIIFGNNEDSYDVLKGCRCGSGSSLPEVTSADNGKVLTVIDGNWGAGEASGGGILKVTTTEIIDEDTATAHQALDHTWRDIFNALTNGYYVCLVSSSDETGAIQTPITTATIDNGKYNVSMGELATYTAQTADDYPMSRGIG